MKADAGFGVPDSITVSAPGMHEAVHTIGEQPKMDRETFQQIRKENTYPSKRAIIEQFTAPMLRELIDAYGIFVEDARYKDNLVDALSRARRAPIEDILQNQSMDSLRQLCQFFEVTVTGRSKSDLIECLTGKRVSGT